MHPFFYSSNLKKLTDKLIYIPYFVLEEIDSSNMDVVRSFSHFAQLPSIINADLVIVQSENIKKFYVESMVLLAGENVREIFEKKIAGTASPKIERIIKKSKDGIDVSKQWGKYIIKDDGTRKKLYCIIQV